MIEVKIGGMGKGGRLNRKREGVREKGEWREGSGRGTSLYTVSFFFVFYLFKIFNSFDQFIDRLINRLLSRVHCAAGVVYANCVPILKLRNYPCRLQCETVRYERWTMKLRFLALLGDFQCEIFSNFDIIF